MEEYEEFCEKALARVQEASLSTESFLPAQAESISLIRFHGVAVLSPLVSLVIIYVLKISPILKYICTGMWVPEEAGRAHRIPWSWRWTT